MKPARPEKQAGAKGQMPKPNPIYQQVLDEVWTPKEIK